MSSTSSAPDSANTQSEAKATAPVVTATTVSSSVVDKSTPDKDNAAKLDKIEETKKRKEWHEKVKGDEFAYLLGVLNLAFSAWLCGAFPASYWMYHWLKLAYLLIFRIYSWSKKKFGFFLTEYCYFINYILLFYYALCYFKGDWFRSVFPYQKTLFRVLFASATGPLATSVIIQGNRLVFHDIEQFTIFSVHLSPAIAMWGMRWFPEALHKTFPNAFDTGCQGKQFDFFDPFFTSTCGDSAKDLLYDVTLYPIFFHSVVWAVPYFIFMFVVERKLIVQNKYRNCFDDFIKDQPSLASYMGKSYLELKYMIGHSVVCALWFVIQQINFRSFHLHTLYLIAIFSLAVHNGGYYYFEIFVTKYVKDKMK